MSTKAKIYTIQIINGPEVAKVKFKIMPKGHDSLGIMINNIVTYYYVSRVYSHGNNELTILVLKIKKGEAAFLPSWNETKWHFAEALRECDLIGIIDPGR